MAVRHERSLLLSYKRKCYDSCIDQQERTCMHQNKVVIWLTLLVATLAAIIVTTLPLPSTWKLPAIEFYLPLAGYSMVASLSVGAAVLFTMSLGVYKAKLRRA